MKRRHFLASVTRRQAIKVSLGVIALATLPAIRIHGVCPCGMCRSLRVKVATVNPEKRQLAEVLQVSMNRLLADGKLCLHEVSPRDLPLSPLSAVQSEDHAS